MSRDALVVGINTYQYLPSLKAPARDAEAIAQRLHMQGEFRVHRLPEVIQNGKPQIGQKTPVTLRELETALINLFKPKGRSVPQTALFYFSGHGIQRDAGIQEGYLALSDSNPDQGFYGLSLFWLRRLLQESPVRQRVILLDCCHSGELLNFLEADPGAHPGTDRLFMAASRDSETAYESLNSEFSVFTEALLTGLDPNRLPSGMITNHSLTDWVNHALKGEIQQPLFESSGSEIILTRCGVGEGSGSGIASQPETEAICPYQGLDCFEESQADYFFGREDLTAQLLQKVTQASFVAVTGASGSGKSSLIRAGLLAQLRQGRAVPGSQHWKVKLITPTENPLKSLAAAFIDPEVSDLERAEQLRRAETFLQAGGTGLAQLVRASLPESGTTAGLLPELRPRFLLAIDQFEEVFTLSHGSQAERERQEFFDCLIGALDQLKDCFNVVIGLRSDFLGKCSLYEGLSQQIFPHQLAVVPLKYEQIKAAIMRPAQKVGLTCEPNLVYTMMMDVIGAPGELPLLQYTLLELWQDRRLGPDGSARLTLDAYQALGGIRGTLQKRATDLFEQLSPEEQAIAKRIFLSLTQLGEGTEDTRRRVLKSELVSPAFPAVLVNQVLEKLVAAKLIVISQANLAAQESSENSAHCATSFPSPVASSPVTSSPVTSSPVVPSPVSFLDGGLSAKRVGAELQETGDPAGETVRSSDLRSSDLRSSDLQEMVDVAHEALIRSWILLRNWLEEQREMLRRQRRIEQAALEWHQAGEPTTGDYLLHGLRLRDAEDFLKLNAAELSSLAQQFIQVSCLECRRVRRASRRLQWGIPSLLVASLTIVFTQYYGVVRTQTEKDDQLQQSIARERAAIAQAVIQDPHADPMTALLISRFAAAAQPASYEAQASLRKALQKLQLQSELPGHQRPIQQIRFSPDRRYLATADASGEIRLWNLDPQTIHNQVLQAEKILNPVGFPSEQSNRPPVSSSPTAPSSLPSMVFSPDGQQLAAIDPSTARVQLWSVETGQKVQDLAGSTALRQVEFSASGRWLVGLAADRRVMIWEVATGQLQAQLMPNPALRQMVLSATADQVLTGSEDGTAQLWQIVPLDRGIKLDLLQTLTHPEVVEQVALSPSDQQVDRWIITRDKAGAVRIWDRQTGQLQRQISGANRPTSLGTTSTSPTPVNAPPLPPIQLPPIQLPPMQQFELGEDAVVALIDRDQQVWVWDIATEQVRIQLPRPIADDKTAVPGQAEQVGSVQLALNHHSIVTTVNQPDPNSGRYGATLWAGSTGALIGQLTGHRQPISALQFSPDGTYVVTASQDGAVRLWAATPGSELPAFRTDQTLPLTFLPNQTLLPTQTLPAQPIATPTSEITSSLPSEARVAQSKELTAAIQTSPRSVVDSLPAQLPARHLPTQNSVSWMARLSRLGAWKPWQAARNSPASIPSASPTAPGSVASIATQLIGIDPQGQLQRWQIRTDPPTLPQMAQAGFSGSHAVAVPIDQRSDQENTWREKLGWFMHRTMASPRLIKTGFAQLPNQLPSRLLSQFADHPSNSSSDQLSRSLNVRETVLSVGSASTASDAIDSTAITSKALSADGRWLATADLQGRISLYQIQSDRSLRRVYQLQNWRSNASLPENAARSVSQVIQSSQPETSQGDPIAIRQLVFSPDGQQLLGIADDLTLRTWYTATGDLNQVFRGHGATIRQARFSADGQWVISASWDRTARIWQAATGRMIQILAHADAVSSVDLNADGRAITASWNGTAQIWQVKTGKPLARLQGHQREILDLRFSPDGQRVVTASADGTARLWNAESGAEEAVLTPPQVTSLPKDVTLETAEADQSGQPIAAIEQATFSPDGQYVATVTATGQVNLWAATPEMLLKLAADRTVRQLTPEECQRYLRLPTDQCPQLP